MPAALPANLPDVANARLPATYEAAKTALANCARIDECQGWADKMAALASYARQVKDDELRKMADRIKARAIRRILARRTWCWESWNDRLTRKPPRTSFGTERSTTRAMSTGIISGACTPAAHCGRWPTVASASSATSPRSLR